MRNSFDKYYGYLIVLMLVVLSGQTIGDKFRTPLYFSASLSIGYDENLLKFSEVEKTNAANSRELMGDMDTFDSSVLRPQVRMTYSPEFFRGHTTNFIAGVAHSSYQQSSSKSYSSYVLKFEQHLGNYSWLKLYYSLAPDYYLRSYRDRDSIYGNRRVCSFDSENLYLSYSLAVYKKTWLQLKLSSKRQYYNAVFTEFNTEIMAGEIRISSSLYDNFRVSTWLSIGEGDNVSYDSGYHSTVDDRSYEFYTAGGSLYYYPDEMVDKIAISVKADRRDYLTDSQQDPLHAGRRHLDIQSSFWMDKALTQSIDAQLKFVYRDKETVSEFDWVEDLKTYNTFQIWLKFSYDFYLDFLY